MQAPKKIPEDAVAVCSDRFWRLQSSRRGVGWKAASGPKLNFAWLFTFRTAHYNAIQFKHIHCTYDCVCMNGMKKSKSRFMANSEIWRLNSLCPLVLFANPDADLQQISDNSRANYIVIDAECRCTPWKARHTHMHFGAVRMFIFSSFISALINWTQLILCQWPMTMADAYQRDESGYT